MGIFNVTQFTVAVFFIVMGITAFMVMPELRFTTLEFFIFAGGMSGYMIVSPPEDLTQYALGFIVIIIAYVVSALGLVAWAVACCYTRNLIGLAICFCEAMLGIFTAWLWFW